ncbi:hypothetical protein PR048_014297 [Dryococelus australis]|uniref:Uncharacterized protein n=1 Tax=Dryococelus australis TaxID=614101 RepID=A0ABQ9HE76_9NEOP|nr:hypothetical protein PR048_014297 [Dryococelus australis]
MKLRKKSLPLTGALSDMRLTLKTADPITAEQDNLLSLLSRNTLIQIRHENSFTIHNDRWKIEASISYFLCFGGGVLIATSFIHIIPEVQEAIEVIKAKDDSIIPKDSEFPWGELCICIGFFLVYLLEEVVHRVFDTPGHDDGKDIVKPKDVAPMGKTVGKIVPTTQSWWRSCLSDDENLPLLVVNLGHPKPSRNTLPHIYISPNSIAQFVRNIPDGVNAGINGRGKRENPEKIRRPVASSATIPTCENSGVTRPRVEPGSPRSSASCCGVNVVLACSWSQVHLLVSSFSIDKLAKETPQVLPPVGGGEEGSHHHHHHHHHCTVHEQQKEPPPPEPHDDGAGSLRGLLMVVALSFHSVFEGLALGLQPTTRDTWYLFGAVAVHTCALLTCIGLELATSGLAAPRVVLYVSVLALVSPVGVAAGLVVTLHSPDGPQALVVAVLQGVAGGTIIYVTFFEVLERERRKPAVPGGGLAKLACVACGFGVMTAIQALGFTARRSTFPLSSRTVTIL